ncbi:MAG: hypothetical protein P4L57_08730 [Rhizomicrobium sp.]|nr:hypothetical protein [Rhizomicrobium sp.]
MPNMRHTKGTHVSRKARLWSVVAVAVGIGALGAYSFASQAIDPPGALPMTPSAVIRTTPDAPHEVPPPVEETR